MNSIARRETQFATTTTYFKIEAVCKLKKNTKEGPATYATTAMWIVGQLFPEINHGHQFRWSYFTIYNFYLNQPLLLLRHRGPNYP